MWPPTAIRRRTPTRGMNTHPWAAAPTAPTTADTADDSRPDLLPKRECKIPDFNWLAVPIEVAASIDA